LPSHSATDKTAVGDELYVMREVVKDK
jgi:hypothetical protein